MDESDVIEPVVDYEATAVQPSASPAPAPAKLSGPLARFMTPSERTGTKAPLVGAAGRERPAREAASKIIPHPHQPGQELEIFKPSHAAEDERWVLVVGKNGSNRKYLCVRCRKAFQGNWERIVAHCLRLPGSGVESCTKLPTDEQKDILARLRDAKAAGGRTALVTAAASPAAGRTPSAAVALMTQRQKDEMADVAITEWAVRHGISAAAVCSRDPTFVNMLQKVHLAGPLFKPVPRQQLMSTNERSEGLRQPGLLLAMRSAEREKRKLFTLCAEEGGTLVSDGAKLKSRKRGMLNSALATSTGVLPLQQTDATGKKKDGDFLSKDLGAAIEKAGAYEEVSKQVGRGDAATTVTKKRSSVVKIVILDRGGGCERALRLLEDKYVVIGDTCKGHGADLLAEDIAKPFKAHLKLVHELIVFIHDHDKPYGIFSGYEGVKALLIPADTRFATELICVRSLLRDKRHVQMLFIEEAVVSWADTQKADIKAKYRKFKQLVVSDEFWHRLEVFQAIEEVIETSLRILDSDQPNLKDAAFAFHRMEIEYGEPLLGKLAAIKDWKEIDLQVELGSEHLGSLSSYVKAMLRKRRADWLSPLVLAAAAVNPVYTYSNDAGALWPAALTQGNGPVRKIITMLCFGDLAAENAATEGWENYRKQRGVYELHADSLQTKVDKPTSFFSHVEGVSNVDADKQFARIATWLCNGFANQSAAERMNKFMVEVEGDKRLTKLDLDKGRDKLELKMHLMYKEGRDRAAKKEQRDGGGVSVMKDLRAAYLGKRVRAKEAAALKERLAQLRADQVAEDAEDGDEESGSPLFTAADAAGVLPADGPFDMDTSDAPLVIPPGYKIVLEAPTADQLDATEEASDMLVGKRLSMNWEGIGWCLGRVIKRNVTVAGALDQRRKIPSGEVATFVVAFDMDEGRPTNMVLKADLYSSAMDAPDESWVFFDKLDASQE